MSSDPTAICFILHLVAWLQAVRTRERELERQTAHRFNAFKYLRDDELGLSLMIADLLDPAGEHGQGTSFLEAMLETLPEANGRFGALQTTVTSPITVLTERQIPNGGRIDITVDIPLGTKPFCLAFENKPYAQDQTGQLRTYLEYLRHEYGEEFLLVYLPPVNREPDEAQSLDVRTRMLARTLQDHALCRRGQLARELVRGLPEVLRGRITTLVPEIRRVVLQGEIWRIQHDDRRRNAIRMRLPSYQPRPHASRARRARRVGLRPE